MKQIQHRARLRTILMAGLMLAVSYAAPAVAQPGTKSFQRHGASPSATVDALVRREMLARGIPGLQVVVVKDSHIVFSRAYGTTTPSHTRQATRSSLFPINSITKAFTGVEVILLAERGQLKLNAPVSDYLSDLPLLWRPLTITQLLSHTSGLPEIVNDNSELLGGGGEEAAWTAAGKLPLRFPPGSRFDYCQTNYALLQRVLEKVTGKPYATLVRDDQAAPSGAHSIAVQHGDQRVSGQVSVYTFLKLKTHGFQTVGVEKTTTLMARDEPIPHLVEAAGGIVSSADDLARWSMTLQHRRIIHSESALTELWRPTPLSDGRYEGLDEIANAYAAGWPVIRRASHPVYAAEGGERAALFIYPRDGVTVIILTNLMGSSPQTFADRVAAAYIPGL